MKGLEKLTSVRLAEVLSQRGLVPPETISAVLYAQEKGGEPLCEAIVSGGQISEWDLARVVVESFQLPFLLASNYDIQPETWDCIDKELLFDAMLVPIGVVDSLITVVMPVMTSFERLLRIQKAARKPLFPYVGLASDNRKILAEQYPEFVDWQKKAAETRAQRVRQQAGAPNREASWMNIFDSADAAVRHSLGGRRE